MEEEKRDLADLFEEEARSALEQAGYKRQDANYRDLMQSANFAAKSAAMLRFNLQAQNRRGVDPGQCTLDELMEEVAKFLDTAKKRAALQGSNVKLLDAPPADEDVIDVEP